MEYLEKSKHIQDQLREIRSEIEVLKVGEKQSELDHLHDEQVRLGETKYSTLRKVSNIIISALFLTTTVYHAIMLFSFFPASLCQHLGVILRYKVLSLLCIFHSYSLLSGL